jgi:hypothetical protein
MNQNTFIGNIVAVNGHWVFGGIDRESGHCIVVKVPNHRTDTLAACIEEHILPGSHIVSDGCVRQHRSNTARDLRTFCG